MQFNARRHMAVCGCAHGVEENLVALQMIDTRRLRAIEPAENNGFSKWMVLFWARMFITWDLFSCVRYAAYWTTALS